MTNKRYTDEEIIKALEYCNADRNECDKCVFQRECESNPFYSAVAEHALDLINRQKSEIERLKKEVSVARDAYISIQDRYEHTKTEAYKEFANKLEEKCGIFTPLGVNWIEEVKAVRVSDIDKILKEMVGE